MTEMEFVNIDVGILKEILEDIPDEYIVRFEDNGMSYPIMNYEVEDEFKELTLKPETGENMNKINEEKFEEYTKIPVTIEAYQTEEEIEIETLEGTMKANVGDWIIKGIKGEYYPCKPDVFDLTYEKPTPKEVICEPEEEPKLNSYIEYSASEMCRAMAEQLEFVNEGSLFIIFGMGSIRLSIDNPDNFLSITRDYIEIFNAENKELTFIKMDDLTGFVFEPPVECDCAEDCDCEDE